MRSFWFVVVVWCVAALAGVARAEPTLAVARFETHTLDPELQPLGRALADMLTTDLARLSGVTVVERAQLAAILAELDLGQTDYVDPDRAVRIGRLLNATHLVSGVLTEHEATLRVEARIVRIEGGDVVASADVTGPRADFFLLEKQLAAAVAEELDVTVTAAEQVELLSRVPTKSLEATLAWARGLDALDRGAIEAAQAELEAALARDGDFDAASAAMSELQSRIDAVMNDRRARAAQEHAALLDELAALRDRRDWKGVSTRWQAVQQRTATLGPRARYHAAAAVVAAEIPDEVGVSGVGTRPTVNESAMAMTILDGHALGYDAEVLATTDAFVQRYPDAALLPALQNTVRQIRNRLDRRTQALIELPRIEARAAAEAHALRCQGLPDRAARQRACLDWARTGAPPVWHAVIDSFAWGADDALRAELEATLAERAPDQTELAARQLAPTADPVLAQAKEALRRKDGELFMHQPFSSMTWPDRIAWLPKATRRWKRDPTVWSWTVVLPARDNQLDKAATALEAFRARFPGHDPRWLTRELEQARDRVKRAEQAELHALLQQAQALDAAGLDAEAAEAWLQLLDTAPADFAPHPAPESLDEAARAVRSAHGPDWDVRVRELWERLVAEHPGTPAAERAARDLETL